MTIDFWILSEAMYSQWKNLISWPVCDPTKNPTLYFQAQHQRGRGELPVHKPLMGYLLQLGFFLTLLKVEGEKKC